MQRRFSLYFSLLLLAAALLGACEKVNLEEEKQQPEVGDGVQVRLSVATSKQLPFVGEAPSSGVESGLAAVCTHITFAIYRADGTVYKILHQKSTASGFGILAISLPVGSYRVIVLAHGGQGNPTFEAWDKVKFKDNKLSDTFYGVKDIQVAEGGSYELELKRAVSKFRLVVSDAIPQRVAKMKFYYTGGSSTFDPISGFGCVNSRQTEYCEVPADKHGAGSQFEIFTFPHAEEDNLKITATALSADNEVVAEHVFEAVPVKRNVITQYSGSFFGGTPGGGQGGGSGEITFRLSFDTNWITITHSY